MSKIFSSIKSKIIKSDSVQFNNSSIEVISDNLKYTVADGQSHIFASDDTDILDINMDSVNINRRPLVLDMPTGANWDSIVLKRSDTSQWSVSTNTNNDFQIAAYNSGIKTANAPLTISKSTNDAIFTGNISTTGALTTAGLNTSGPTYFTGSRDPSISSLDDILIIRNRNNSWRWKWKIEQAETGNNAGSILQLVAFGDSGAGTLSSTYTFERTGKFISPSVSSPLVSTHNGLNTQKKVVLFDNQPAEDINTATNFFGFGMNSNVLRYQVNQLALSSHKFYGSTTELMSIGNTIDLKRPVTVTADITSSNRMIYRNAKTGLYENNEGVIMDVYNATITNTNTASTINNIAAMYIGVQAFASTTPITYTNVSSLYVNGPPNAGTNTTITNRYNIFAPTGLSKFGELDTDYMRLNSSLTNRNKILAISDNNINEDKVSGTYFKGFGNNVGALRYQVPTLTDIHKFYCAAVEVMRIGTTMESLGQHNFSKGIVTTGDVDIDSAFNGVQIDVRARTIRHTTATAGSTVPLYTTVQFVAPILSGTNAFTYTNAFNLRIVGAPVAGTNVTLGSSYAFGVSGPSKMDSIDVAGAINTSNNINIAMGALNFTTNRTAAYSNAQGVLINTGSITVWNTNSATLTNLSAAAFTVPYFACNVTNASTVYIAGSPAAVSGGTITNSYALYVESGTTKLSMLESQFIQTNPGNFQYNKIISVYDATPTASRASATDFMGFGNNGTSMRYQTPTGVSHKFFVNTSEVMDITANSVSMSGRLAINSTAGGAAIQLQKTGGGGLMWGTTASDAAIGYAASTGTWSAISGAGDLCLRSDATKNINIGPKLSIENDTGAITIRGSRDVTTNSIDRIFASRLSNGALRWDLTTRGIETADDGDGSGLQLTGYSNSGGTTMSRYVFHRNGTFEVGNTNIGINYSKNMSTSGTGLHYHGNNTTVTNTAESTTTNVVANMRLGIATITSINTTNFNHAASLYIPGAPVASTNTTIQFPWSVYVEAGASRFNGPTQVNNTFRVYGGATQLFQNTLELLQGRTAAFTVSRGLLFHIDPMTITNTGGGNISNVQVTKFTAPTLSSTTTSVINTAATISIDGAPMSGTNTTITNPLALEVQSGKSRFGGDVEITGTLTASSITAVLPTVNTDASPTVLDLTSEMTIINGTVSDVRLPTPSLGRKISFFTKGFGYLHLPNYSHTINNTTIANPTISSNNNRFKLVGNSYYSFMGKSNTEWIIISSPKYSTQIYENSAPTPGAINNSRWSIGTLMTMTGNIKLNGNVTVTSTSSSLTTANVEVWLDGPGLYKVSSTIRPLSNNNLRTAIPINTVWTGMPPGYYTVNIVIYPTAITVDNAYDTCNLICEDI